MEEPSKPPQTVVLEHKTGSTYSGPTVEGRMEGRGEYLFATGTKYIGDMRDGMYVYTCLTIFTII